MLPGAVGAFEVEPGGFKGHEAGRCWRMRVAPLPPLVLGAISLERIRVDVVFSGYGPEEKAAFLARFRAGIQRGGG